MWYLQIETLRLLLLACAVSVAGALALRKTGFGRLTEWLLLLVDALLLCAISKRLAAVYALYTLFSYGLIVLVRRAERGRRALFVLFCFASVAPFFYIKAAAAGAALPMPVVVIGFSYNMLKAVDALFFTYYGRQHIGFVRYAGYLLFFPVFTAGPIMRFRDYNRSMQKPLPLDASQVETSVKRVIRGMFKKMVVVAFLALVMQRLLEASPHWYGSALILAVSYLTLYFDLSGYSDIAIAFAGMAGVKVEENFKQPWTAASFTQFWRKWHVTLSDWIREHIFVVIQGKKLTHLQGGLMGLATMLIMSLWHEFSLYAVLSGGFMGLCLFVESLLGLTTVDKRRTKKPVLLLRCLLVNGFFAINSLFFTLDAAQTIGVLRGFLHL